MASFMKRLVYLTEEQLQTLFSTGTLTVDGRTITYSDDDMYVTPQPTPLYMTDMGSGLALSGGKVVVTGKLDASQKGAIDGVAELGHDGKVPSSQLPSYVDDVLEYAALASFPATGETGKIYVALDTNKTYRWSGSTYIEISSSLALGETSGSAYRGDRGAAAYAHALAKGTAAASGFYKITTNAEGHVTSVTAVSKADITALGIPAQDTTYAEATSAAAGLMSSADKAKLDALNTTLADYALKDNTVITGSLSMNRMNVADTTGDYSVSLGWSNKAQGEASAAFGISTLATGKASFTSGQASVAEGYAAHAEGMSGSYGTASHSEGMSYARGDYSHSEGKNTSSEGEGSHSEGVGGTYEEEVDGETVTKNYGALYDADHAEGWKTIADSSLNDRYAAHAEGSFTKAMADSAHAEGIQSIASGASSHAEGNGSKASGASSHAEGVASEASASGSHAEGYHSNATAAYAHAEGRESVAAGLASHAEGYCTRADRTGHHVVGRYNITDTVGSASNYYGKYVEIVGNGTSSARSNARTVDWSGNEWLAGTMTCHGSITIGNTSITESQLASVVEVLANIVDATGVSF